MISDEKKYTLKVNVCLAASCSFEVDYLYEQVEKRADSLVVLALST